MRSAEDRPRCGWARTPLSIEYHDLQWGVPVHDERLLFEMLILEGAQAGLSWETILKKRKAYREAFDRFDPRKVAAYRAPRIRELLRNEGIIRNRLKIEAAINNARVLLELQKDSTFDSYLWQFVDGHPIQNARRSLAEVPSTTEISDRLSRDMKARGFRFAGSTILYAFMQAVGMVNDHVVGCFRYSQVAESAQKRRARNR